MILCNFPVPPWNFLIFLLSNSTLCSLRVFNLIFGKCNFNKTLLFARVTDAHLNDFCIWPELVLIRKRSRQLANRVSAKYFVYRLGRFIYFSHLANPRGLNEPWIMRFMDILIGNTVERQADWQNRPNDLIYSQKKFAHNLIVYDTHLIKWPSYFLKLWKIFINPVFCNFRT